MQLASDIERRMPEPCAPVSLTFQMPSLSGASMPRWYSVRPGFLRIGDREVACRRGKGVTSAPIMRSSASRTKK